MGLVHQRLDGFDHFSEHLVGGSLDDDQNGVCVLLELPGIGVDLKTVFFYEPADLLPGLITDIWMIVEHSGDGCHTVSGLFCQILNGHKMTSFIRRGISALHRTGSNTLDNVLLT